MLNKNCNKCNQLLSISKFNKTSTGEYKSSCVECLRLYKIELRKKNRQNYRNSVNIYRKENKWIYIYDTILQRCNNPKNVSYNIYGGRGIKCLITINEIKQLMIRDNYWSMKKPSIDRIDNDGDYTFDNCKFMESGKNTAKSLSIPILQFNKKDIFIREWESAREVERVLNISASTIGYAIQKKRGYKSAGGYIWRYKNASK